MTEQKGAVFGEGNVRDSGLVQRDRLHDLAQCHVDKRKDRFAWTPQQGDAPVWPRGDTLELGAKRDFDGPLRRVEKAHFAYRAVAQDGKGPGPGQEGHIG